MPLAAVAVSFFLAEAARWVPQGDNLGLQMPADFIVIFSVAAIGLGLAQRRRKGSTAAAPEFNAARLQRRRPPHACDRLLRTGDATDTRSHR
jgi:hypothetical protein